MPFTDDDLKRLKAKEGYWKTSIKMNEGQSESWGFVDGKAIDALLARLTAAESALFTHGEDNCESCQKWRKAEGK